MSRNSGVRQFHLRNAYCRGDGRVSGRRGGWGFQRGRQSGYRDRELRRRRRLDPVRQWNGRIYPRASVRQRERRMPDRCGGFDRERIAGSVIADAQGAMLSVLPHAAQQRGRVPCGVGEGRRVGRYCPPLRRWQCWHREGITYIQSPPSFRRLSSGTPSNALRIPLAEPA
jgi:hypothetical protein